MNRTADELGEPTDTTSGRAASAPGERKPVVPVAGRQAADSARDPDGGDNTVNRTADQLGEPTDTTSGRAAGASGERKPVVPVAGEQAADSARSPDGGDNTVNRTADQLGEPTDTTGGCAAGAPGEREPVVPVAGEQAADAPGAAGATARATGGPAGRPADRQCPSGAPVDEFGTGFLLTRIRRHGRGFLWERRPGELRREPFSPVPDEVREAVARSVAGLSSGMAPVLGVPRGGVRLYPAAAARSVGHLMLSALDARQRALLHRLLYEVGRVVRRVHEGVDVTLADGRPRGAARLASWLRTEPADGHRAGDAAVPGHSLRRLSALAGRRLGRLRLERVLRWCEDLTADRDDHVFLLGGVSSGALVPGTAPGAGALLAGEELARGQAAYDLGWLLGELAEFRLLHLTRPGHADLREHCAESARSFLRGYGDVTDPVAVGRTAALRVFTHAHDYAAYVGWTDELPAHLDCVADLIDTDGAAATPPTAPTTPRENG